MVWAAQALTHPMGCWCHTGKHLSLGATWIWMGPLREMVIKQVPGNCPVTLSTSGFVTCPCYYSVITIATGHLPVLGFEQFP